MKYAGRSRTRFQRARLWCERLFLASGLALITVYGAARLHSELYSRYDQRAFERARAGRPVSRENFASDRLAIDRMQPAATPSSLPDRIDIHAADDANQEDWSVQRRRTYLRLKEDEATLPMAKLEIPAVGLTAMVREGTDPLTLNRGVGHIAGTSFPGQFGNIGIAGHRDGYFRKLGDLSLKDLVVITTRTATYRYRVQQIAIVNPSDVSVLKQHASPELTLVTCFPIRFVGAAPKRLVVTAKIDLTPPAD
jgi:sortase A